jgi:hypothetical protein
MRARDLLPPDWIDAAIRAAGIAVMVGLAVGYFMVPI